MARLPQLRLQAVELDPVVVDVAYKYFGLPRDPRLQVDVGDGRQFLAGDEKRWDVIVIDAFFADAIPAHLVTQEFLALVRSRLAPGGVVVTNAIGAIGARLEALPLDLQDLPDRVPVRARAPGDPPRRQGDEQFRNLILIATEKATPAGRSSPTAGTKLRARTRASPTSAGRSSTAATA